MNDINEIKGVKQKQFCTFITDLIWKTENSHLQKGMAPAFFHQEQQCYCHNHKYFSNKMW